MIMLDHGELACCGSSMVASEVGRRSIPQCGDHLTLVERFVRLGDRSRYTILFGNLES
jgi:hypothetical protein